MKKIPYQSKLTRLVIIILLLATSSISLPFVATPLAIAEPYRPECNMWAPPPTVNDADDDVTFGAPPEIHNNSDRPDWLPADCPD